MTAEYSDEDRPMTTSATTYNYDTFHPGIYVDEECKGPVQGDDVGEFTVHTTDGRQRKLRDLIGRVTVIETGSTTRPLYCANVPRMRTVAARHHPIDFVMLYTREAHPDDRRGSHRDLSDKLDAATGISDDPDEWRQVVVVDKNAHVLGWLHDADATAVDRFLEVLAHGAITMMESTFPAPSPTVTLRALMRGGAKAVLDFAKALPTLIRYRLTGGADC